MRYVIISGMSGAGKSHAAKCFEDMGYYCIDNMPGDLIYTFAELCSLQGQHEKVALVCDIRGGRSFNSLLSGIDNIKKDGNSCEVLFLDADDNTLIQRYKETRRRHPLESSEISLSEAIKQERNILKPLRSRATNIINTADMLPKHTAKEIRALYSSNGDKKGLSTYIISFGFKHGIPLDCDLIFDVRFLPNPYYIPELKAHNGTEKCVSDYVMKHDSSKEFLRHLTGMIDFLLPNYADEGRTNIVIGIGCTGGKHRSVTIAEQLNMHIETLGYSTKTFHRDFEK